MKVIIVDNYDQLSLAAHKVVATTIKAKQKVTLGLATGSTPEGLYSLLISDQTLNWSKVTTFNLDEYIGLKPSDKQSYHHYMQAKLFDHINIDKKRTHLPLGIGDINKNRRAYDEMIDKSGGIDLQILGIGENGHIAFNEPGSLKTNHTQRVKLTASTINANARNFASIKQVPTEALTMGIGRILQAKSILLLGSGLKKAQAIQKTIEGNVTAAIPASYLQEHPNVTIIIDQAAGSLLK